MPDTCPVRGEVAGVAEKEAARVKDSLLRFFK